MAVSETLNPTAASAAAAVANQPELIGGKTWEQNILQNPLNYNPNYLNNPLDANGNLQSQFTIPGAQQLSNAEYAQNQLAQTQGIDTANQTQATNEAKALASNPVKGSSGTNNIGEDLYQGMNNSIAGNTAVGNAALGNVATIGNNVANTQNQINQANITNQLAAGQRANNFNLGVYNSQAGGQAANLAAESTAAAANSGKK